MAKKNHTIIWVAVIAVLAVGGAVYFLKRKTVSTTPYLEPEGSSIAKAVPQTGTSDIINALGVGQEVSVKLKKMVDSIKISIDAGNTGWNKKTLEESARKQNISYDRQLVISALWQLYATAKSISESDYTYYRDILLGYYD